MKPDKIGSTIRQFIPMGIAPMVDGFLDKVDMTVEGPQLLQVS